MIRSVSVLTGMTEQRDKLMMQKNKQMITGTESLSGQRESTDGESDLGQHGGSLCVRREGSRVWGMEADRLAVFGGETQANSY